MTFFRPHKFVGMNISSFSLHSQSDINSYYLFKKKKFFIHTRNNGSNNQGSYVLFESKYVYILHKLSDNVSPKRVFCLRSVEGHYGNFSLLLFLNESKQQLILVIRSRGKRHRCIVSLSSWESDSLWGQRRQVETNQSLTSMLQTRNDKHDHLRSKCTCCCKNQGICRTYAKCS